MRLLNVTVIIFSWAVSVFLLFPVAAASNIEWPDRDKGRGEDWKIVTDRYANASKKPLGTDEDVGVIKKLIVAHMKQPQGKVNEIRWLSPNLIMAESSWHQAPKAGATYYYVAEKKKDAWEIKTYYLLKIE